MWFNRRNTQPQQVSETLWLVAGGSGGHILPALELAKRWSKHHPKRRVILFTLQRKLDRLITENNPILDTVVPLSLPPLPRGRYFLLPAFMVRFLVTFLRVFFRGIVQRPSRVITTGGLVAVPVCMAAKVLGSSIDVVELNAEFGSATALLTRIATRIRVVFPEALARKPQFAECTSLIDYPLRTPQAPTLSRDEALIVVGSDADVPFAPERTTLFVVGGSQGSRFLSRAVIAWLDSEPETLRGKLQVIHQVGEHDSEAVGACYAERGIPAVIFPYRRDLAPCYQAADLVLSRAGAGTLHELVAFSKRTILIPLETAATVHQLANATSMAGRHPDLFTLIRQRDVLNDASSFHQTINQALTGITDAREGHGPVQPSPLEIQGPEPQQ